MLTQISIKQFPIRYQDVMNKSWAILLKVACHKGQFLIPLAQFFLWRSSACLGRSAFGRGLGLLGFDQAKVRRPDLPDPVTISMTIAWSIDLRPSLMRLI